MVHYKMIKWYIMVQYMNLMHHERHCYALAGDRKQDGLPAIDVSPPKTTSEPQLSRETEPRTKSVPLGGQPIKLDKGASIKEIPSLHLLPPLFFRREVPNLKSDPRRRKSEK